MSNKLKFSNLDSHFGRNIDRKNRKCQITQLIVIVLTLMLIIHLHNFLRIHKNAVDEQSEEKEPVDIPESTELDHMLVGGVDRTLIFFRKTNINNNLERN